MEDDCELGESFFEVFRVNRIFHEQELLVGKSVHKEHDPDFVDRHSTRGFRIKDDAKLATMVGEVMDELGKVPVFLITSSCWKRLCATAKLEDRECSIMYIAYESLSSAALLNASTE